MTGDLSDVMISELSDIIDDIIWDEKHAKRAAWLDRYIGRTVALGQTMETIEGDDILAGTPFHIVARSKDRLIGLCPQGIPVLLAIEWLR